MSVPSDILQTLSQDLHVCSTENPAKHSFEVLSIDRWYVSNSICGNEYHVSLFETTNGVNYLVQFVVMSITFHYLKPQMVLIIWFLA
jgi:hypothetical protein